MLTGGGPVTRTTELSRREKLFGVLICLALLLVTGGVVFIPLLVSGRSNIYDVDGLTQHYAAMRFVRETLVQFVSSPGQGLPMWTWRLGFGADVLSTLSYYVADPFALVSLVFPLARFELAYLVTYWLKLLCAGLAAYAYLRTLKCTTLASAIGSIVYVFTTFSLFIALRHPWFGNPMIWLPLILMGVEHVLSKRKPYLLVAAIALAAANNFYFFFMIAIVTTTYAAVRYADTAQTEKRWSGLLPTAGRVAGWILLGIASAAIVLVPVAFAVLDSSRFGSSPGLRVLHPLADYPKYFIGIGSSYVSPNSAFMGYSIIGIVMLPVLLVRRRMHTTTKFMTGFFAAVLALPLLGSLFNGLGFVSYRVMFAWGLFFAAAVAQALSGPPLTRREVRAAAVGVAAYAVSVAVALVLMGQGIVARTTRQVPVSWQVFLPIVLGALMVALLAVESGLVGQRWVPDTCRRRGRLGASWALWGVIALVMMNLGSNAILLHTSYGSDSLNEYLKRSGAERRYVRSQPPDEVLEAASASFFRVDKQRHAFGTTLKPIGSNDALEQGYYGLTSYFSILNRPVYELLNEVGIRSRWIGFGWSGLDDRTDLLALSCVRYYVAENDLKEFVPFGFSEVFSDADSSTYENRFALPIGYLYSRTLLRPGYERLPALGKQQALLQGAVVDGADAADVAPLEAWTDYADVPYTTETSPGVSIDLARRTITTVEPKSAITLLVNTPPESEVFVEMTGVRAEVPDGDPGPRALNFVYSVGDGPGKMARTYLPAHNYYFGDHTQFVNLGYREDGVQRIVIRPNDAGIARFESLKVYAAPVSRYLASVQRLRAQSLTNVAVSDTTVSGDIDSLSGGFLAFSIPYSRGWSAQVDGRPVAVRRVNTAFLGFPVSGGPHKIALSYRTPGLFEGTAVTLAAAVFLLVFWFVDLSQRRTRR